MALLPAFNPFLPPTLSPRASLPHSLSLNPYPIGVAASCHSGHGQVGGALAPAHCENQVNAPLQSPAMLIPLLREKIYDYYGETAALLSGDCIPSATNTLSCFPIPTSPTLPSSQVHG